MPLIIPAIIGGVAAIGSTVAGVIGNNAANKAARNNANSNNALSQANYDTTRGLVQPYIDRGGQAADALQGFLGLGGDPVKTQAAFDHYLNSTGYQFTRQQGIDAATQSAAGQGLLNSGGALKALQDRGTNLAQQYGQQYASNLDSVSKTGISGVNALVQAGNGNVNNQTNNNNGATGVQESAYKANGNAVGGLIDTLGGFAQNAFGASRGSPNTLASSFGGMAAQNTLSPGVNAMTGYNPKYLNG